jgi:hypothetical protein
MFCIDSGDFLNDPLSFGFNTMRQSFLVLHVFDFQGPSARQTEPIFLPHQYFRILRIVRRRSQRGTQGG